uniref:BZIP domain-containing protein n=1 Tax=Globodera rostochiensis TaxID=31243 RepID=A0A914HH45_GLORO
MFQDQAYYERRRKNNDAAKRSRDTRRLKEEVTAQRAAYLERENSQLKKQVGLLSAELAKHKAVLLSLAPPPNVPSMLQKTPPKASNASCRRQCHVLASPTSTTGVNEATAECHSAKKNTVAEENGIRSCWKREGNDDEPNITNRPSGLIDANIS